MNADICIPLLLMGELVQHKAPMSLMPIEPSDLLRYFYFVFVLVFKAEFVALVLVVLVVASQVVQNRPFGKGQAFWVILNQFVIGRLLKQLLNFMCFFFNELAMLQS